MDFVGHAKKKKTGHFSGMFAMLLINIEQAALSISKKVRQKLSYVETGIVNIFSFAA